MDVSSDFSDLLRAFNAAGVRYLVGGGHAMAVHDEPRFTKDLHVWVEPTAKNAGRTYRALGAFGAPLDHVKPEDFGTDDLVFQIGVAPLRIDVMTSITGVAFADAWADRVDAKYGDVPVSVIGRSALIANQTATARPQDLVDVRRLVSRPPTSL